MKLLNYSWKEYLIVLGIVLFVYYVYVILRYYRQDFINFVKGNSKPQKKNEDEIIDPFQKKNVHSAHELSPADAENHALAEELIGRAQDLISDASAADLEKEDLMEDLKYLFREYSNITDEVLRFGISELIHAECNRNGRFSLDRRTVDDLWSEQSS